MDNSVDQPIKTYLTWGDVFYIEFDIIVNKLPTLPMGIWTNIFHFSASGADNANYGDRIPAVFIHNNGLDYSYIQIASAVSGNKNHIVDVQFSVGILYKITIRQYKDFHGQHWFEVLVNNKSYKKIVNSQPKIFRNVKLYVSNPWMSSFTADFGNVCNLIIRHHQ